MPSATQPHLKKKICWQTDCQFSSLQNTFTREAVFRTNRSWLAALYAYLKMKKKNPKHPKKTTKKPNQTKECQALVANSNDEHWKNWILEEAKQVKFRIKVQFLKEQMWFNHLTKLQNKTMDFSLSIFKLRLLSFSGKYFMVSQVSYWIQHWWNLPSCSI